MPYINTIERYGIRKGKELGLKKGKELGLKKGKELGLKRGKEQGRLENAQESILEVLEVRFGSVPSEIRTRIGQITDVETCKTLHVRAISATTLDEFNDEIGA